MNLYHLVKNFHDWFRVGAPATPVIPDDETIRLRCRMQVEETLELLEACFESSPECWSSVDIARARNILNGVCEQGRVDVNLVGYADANADIRYIAYGNDIAAGIDATMIDSEVHASNMTKQAAGEGKKVKKGPAYVKPDIAGCLRAMGWRG